MVNKTLLLVSILLCGLTAGVLSACGDDDDKDDEKKDSMEAMYHVLVSEDVLKVADVTVHYLDENGKETTERMTTTEWKKTWTTTTLPARIGVWPQLKPKSAGGGVQLKDSYQLKAVATAGYQFHAAKGGEWADGWVNVADPTADPEKVAAADISGWCSKSAAVACEVDSKGKGKSVEADFGGNFYFFGNSFCMWLMTVFGLPEDNCVE